MNFLCGTTFRSRSCCHPFLKIFLGTGDVITVPRNTTVFRVGWWHHPPLKYYF
jgi:hypothetical protein